VGVLSPWAPDPRGGFTKRKKPVDGLCDSCKERPGNSAMMHGQAGCPILCDECRAKRKARVLKNRIAEIGWRDKWK
jgi:hypothetical protein